MKMAELGDLIGKTLVKAEQVGVEKIVFITSDGECYTLHHHQDCGESVTIEDVVGNLSDLVGEPILVAEAVTSNSSPEGIVKELSDPDNSFTWTFYKFATIKGYVDIRWFGESNGYYSEKVNFDRVDSISHGDDFGSPAMG